jgi:hypothetical protein
MKVWFVDIISGPSSEVVSYLTEGDEASDPVPQSVNTTALGGFEEERRK